MRQPLLKRILVIRLGRILNMLYKPSELANEIGVTVDAICRSNIPTGLPQTDEARTLPFWRKNVSTARNASKTRRLPLAARVIVAR